VFYVIETLTKLLYCSGSVEATMFLLQDTATSPTHIPYPQYNLKFWSGTYRTWTTAIIPHDSHVTIGTIQQTQDAPNVPEYANTNYCIVGMRLDQRSYSDSWKLVERPWHSTR